MMDLNEKKHDIFMGKIFMGTASTIYIKNSLE